MRSTSKKIALVVAALTAITLAGCGGKEPGSAEPAPVATSAAPADNGIAALSADEILTRAKAALKQAKSFRAKGSMVEGADRTDLDLKVSGADFTVSMTMGEMKIDLLAVGGQKYMRGNAEFFAMSGGAEQGKALSTLVGDRWISGAAGDESFGSMFNIASVDEILKPSGALSKGAEQQIGGVPTISLKDAGDADNTLYVATTGEPLPVQVGAASAAVVFSSFGETFAEIKAPTADQVVDLNKLKK